MSKGKGGYHQSHKGLGGMAHVVTATHNAGKATHLQPTRGGKAPSNDPTGKVKRFGHNKETHDQAK